MTSEQKEGRSGVCLPRDIGWEEEDEILGLIYSVRPEDRPRATLQVGHHAWHVLVVAGRIRRALHRWDVDRLFGVPVSVSSCLDPLAVEVTVMPEIPPLVPPVSSGFLHRLSTACKVFKEGAE